VFFSLVLAVHASERHEGLYRRQGECAAVCANIVNAVEHCPTTSPGPATCLCPTISPSWSACSECYVSVNGDTADAAIVATYYDECQQLQCAPYCENILNAFVSCSTLAGASSQYACLCPTVLPSAASCSECYLSISGSSALANDMATLYSDCLRGPESTGGAATQTAANTGANTAANSPTATALLPTPGTGTTAGAAQTASANVVTTTVKSGVTRFGSEGFGSGILHLILFLAFVSGVVVAFW
jgi:hypothetical protein